MVALKSILLIDILQEVFTKRLLTFNISEETSF